MTNGSNGDRPTVQYGDEEVERGTGGETHQVLEDGHDRLTTRQGTPVADDQNTLCLGCRAAVRGGRHRRPARAAVMALVDDGEVTRFVEQCRALRFWERELNTVTVG